MSKVRILYRADGGHPVGMGHIMRALRVVRELSALVDLEALLVTRHNQAVAHALVKEEIRNLQLSWLPPVDSSIIPVLGGGEFIDTARNYNPDIIVVDTLDTPEDEMSGIAGLGTKIAVLDDRGLGRVYADLIVNFLVRDPNPSVLKPGAKLLQGPHYAPLSPEYTGSAGRRRPVEPVDVRIVTVTMGGADATGLAVKVAEALLLVPELEEVRFSLGPAFEKMTEMESVVKKASWKASLLVSIPSLLPVFIDSDIAIVAGGITMHETACCGLPSIALCQPIDHQLLVAENLQSAGAMMNLGYGVEASTKDIAKAVRELCIDRDKRQMMAESGPSVVDGLGTRRVAQALAGMIRTEK